MKPGMFFTARFGRAATQFGVVVGPGAQPHLWRVRKFRANSARWTAVQVLAEDFFIEREIRLLALPSIITWPPEHEHAGKRIRDRSGVIPWQRQVAAA